MISGFQCAGCGEWNDTTVDESAGHNQTYVEDCQVCWASGDQCAATFAIQAEGLSAAKGCRAQ